MNAKAGLAGRSHLLSHQGQGNAWDSASGTFWKLGTLFLKARGSVSQEGADCQGFSVLGYSATCWKSLCTTPNLLHAPGGVPKAGDSGLGGGSWAKEEEPQATKINT